MTTTDCTPRHECRVCGYIGKTLIPVLNLGDQPLANQYVPPHSPAIASYPLQLNLCIKCYHLQLSHVVKPEILYKNYLYASGTNKTIARYFEWLAGKINDEWQGDTDKTKTILEIASNDGTQLDCFKERGWMTFGIDPAENITSKIHPNRGHHITCDFWEPESAKIFQNNGITFDVILAQNVAAHVDDIHSFIQACQNVMHEDSLLYIQTSQCRMIQRNEFDTIYSEHLSFFSVRSMQTLLKSHHLYLKDVSVTDIHGDSFLFTISMKDDPNKSVSLALEKERQDGIYDLKTYRLYEMRCHSMINELKLAIHQAKNEGYKIVAYGAAAKGMTLLNFAGLNNSDIAYVVDDAPMKQGLYCPGSHIPIVPSSELQQDPNNKLMIVVLAWNFYEEIRVKLQSLFKDINTKKVVLMRCYPEIVMTHNDFVKEKDIEYANGAPENASFVV